MANIEVCLYALSIGSSETWTNIPTSIAGTACVQASCSANTHVQVVLLHSGLHQGKGGWEFPHSPEPEMGKRWETDPEESMRWRDLLPLDVLPKKVSFSITYQWHLTTVTQLPYSLITNSTSTIKCMICPSLCSSASNIWQGSWSCCSNANGQSTLLEFSQWIAELFSSDPCTPSGLQWTLGCF